MSRVNVIARTGQLQVADRLTYNDYTHGMFKIIYTDVVDSPK